MINHCKTTQELRRFVYSPVISPERDRQIIDHLIDCLDCRAHTMKLLDLASDRRGAADRRRGDRRQSDRGRISGDRRAGGDRRMHTDRRA